jgi:hypothetical protein
MSERDRNRTQAETQTERTRLPYEPPAVISEEVFETLALSCAKANPFACPGGNPDRS